MRLLKCLWASVQHQTLRPSSHVSQAHVEQPELALRRDRDTLFAEKGASVPVTAAPRGYVLKFADSMFVFGR